MLWYFLLASKELTTWEHRVGCFYLACKMCQRESWQLTFRLYQTEGSTISPATPYSFPLKERFQIRCTACSAATTVGHPQTWTPYLGVPFQNEQGAVTRAVPQYVSLAYMGPSGGY
jgi:hypothetical protein